MAVQGGLTITFDNHIYFNAWGSNVNFQTVQNNTATVEMDTVIGYSNKLSDDFNYDLHLVRYNYPRTSDAAYNEFIASASYKFLTALFGYSSNVFTSHGEGTYFNVGVNFIIPTELIRLNDITFSGGIGHYDLNNRAGNSYWDYNLQLQKSITDTYVIALQWTDTNGAFNYHPYDNSHIVATISATF